jgi:CobQ-like glutamine amidotransferase family enzyme
MTDMELVVGWLYPDLMSTYGDRGNVICIKRRCEWRGIRFKVVPLDSSAHAADVRAVDLFVGGGAQDRQQEIVMRNLRGAQAEAIHDKIERETPGVFTCGSPQLLGHYYEPMQGQRIEGLGIFDFVTIHPGPGAARCIGNLVYEITALPIADELKAAGDATIVIGFENHGGRTHLGNFKPFGRVLRGYGNNGEDKSEGAIYHNALATYSHGPLLPKNPFIADWLIRKALEVKFNQAVSLAPLDDSLAQDARKVMLKRFHLQAE